MTGTSAQPLGEVLRDGGRLGVRFVRDLAHPRERVWRAITEHDQLRHWMPCDIVGERRVGADLVLPFWPAHAEKYHLEGPAPTGRVTAWEPPAVFGWTWGGDDLRFELEPTASGTRLTLTTWVHSAEPDEAAGTAGGYHACLDALRELLDTGAARPLVDADDDARAFTAQYAGAIRG